LLSVITKSEELLIKILTFLKMIEATNIRTIDDIINQVQKIEPKKETIISKPLELVVEKSIEYKITKASRRN